MKNGGSLCDYYRYGGLVVTHNADGSILSIDFEMPNGDKDDFEMDIFEWLEFINYLSDPSLQCLTVTGGDPLDNFRLANDVILIAKMYAPKAKIILASCRPYEEMAKDPVSLVLLKKCDYYSDGRFIDIAESIKSGAVVLPGS